MKSVSVELRDVCKKFKPHDGKSGEETFAVKNVSFTAAEGQFVTLLGPSGCGKTTTLRMVAGFEEPSGGDILFGSTSVINTPPNKRNASMVFQSYALFPHMTVFENIAYGLKLRKMQNADIQKKVLGFMDTMGLKGMENRRISQLSGGQQQRVALTRALITEPSVLLFDEPLSNLDAKLRVQMRDEIRSLQQRLKITALYVTHDQEEAMVLSDTMIVLNKGEIAQIGTPQEIYRRPASRFVAEFMGNANFLEAEITGQEGNTLNIILLGEKMRVTSPSGAIKNKKAVCMLRPEAVTLTLPEQSALKGKIKQIVNLGSHSHVTVEVNASLLKCLVLHSAVGTMPREAQNVGIMFHQESVHILPD